MTRQVHRHVSALCGEEGCGEKEVTGMVKWLLWDTENTHTHCSVMAQSNAQMQMHTAVSQLQNDESFSLVDERSDRVANWCKRHTIQQTNSHMHASHKCLSFEINFDAGSQS